MSQKKPSNTSQFSIRQLVSAYNAYYRQTNPLYMRKVKTNKGKDEWKGLRLQFRVYEKEKSGDTKKDAQREAKKFVINMNDFNALKDFVKAYNSGKANKMDYNYEKDKDGSERPTNSKTQDEYLKFLVEDYVYDIYLRSCLNLAATGFKLYSKNKAENDKVNPPSIFYDFLIPQLGFTKGHESKPDDYIKSLREYFESDALRIKGYNKVFPHSIRNEDKKHKGINYVFLQRLCPNYIDVLKSIISKKKSDPVIIAECLESFCKNKKVKKLINEDKQLIISSILNGPPMIKRTKKNGEEVEEPDSKWINRLHDSSDKTNAKLIGDDMKKVMTDIIHDLMSVKAFVGVVRNNINSAENEEIVSTAYEKFTEMCDELDTFNANHKNIENSFVGFIKYIVDAYFILKNVFDIPTPLKMIASAVKTTAEFKFTKQLKDIFDKLVAAHEKGDEESISYNINEAAKYCEENLSSISVVRGYDFLDKSLDIYSSVGKYCKINLPKNYRVAMGIAIIKWINDRIAIYAAENKKREVLIIDIKE